MRFWPPLPKASSESGGLDPLVWKITTVAVLGSFLSQLDATVVNVSLSSLAVDLHSSLTAIQWVTSGYLLALALMLPLNGWLVERIGAKSLYLWCFSAFTLSSALCGLAWSANSLTAFRILQGMSGGLMAPMAQMMMARAAGKHMARIIGYAAVPVMLGPILGPVIAGAILQHASWRWLFLVNLPVGVLAIVLAVLFLPNDREEIRSRELDLPGFALLSPGLVLFLYGSDHPRRAVSVLRLSWFPSFCLRSSSEWQFAKEIGSTHRPAAIPKSRTFSASRHHAVHVERNLVRGPDADSDLSHPRMWSIAERDRLAAGSAWSGDDLFLSMDGSPDTAGWYTKGIGRRRASGLRRHPAISFLPGQSRTRLRRAGRCSIPARSGPERSWHSLHLGCIRVREKTGPADGDNLSQHRAASRRPDSDHALRDLPGMEVGDGTVRRQSLRRIYRCLSSTLRITRFPVCCRPEITSFPGQSDRTTSCRRIACLIGGDGRVIRESKPGNVDVSIKIAGGPLDCCKTADSLTERFRCVE